MAGIEMELWQLLHFRKLLLAIPLPQTFGLQPGLKKSLFRTMLQLLPAQHLPARDR